MPAPLKTILIVAAVAAGLVDFALPVTAAINKQDDGPIASALHTPVYVWQDADREPQAIVLAIHGLAMHGQVFDSCARHLASRGMIVAAPDLRGCGKWYHNHKSATVDYKESEDDIVALAKKLREAHKGLPLFVAGESLGGSLAIRLAAKHPNMVDGLILSAPAVGHRYHIPLRTLAEGTLFLINPSRKVDVCGYFRNYYSEDPRIAQDTISDPLVRKNLSLGELLSSCRLIASSADCIGQIPDSMPVLIMQGQKDRMLKLSSIIDLTHKLRSNRQTVLWFPKRGHILLETARVQPETLNAITVWLEGICVMRRVDGAAVAIEQAAKPVRAVTR